MASIRRSTTSWDRVLFTTLVVGGWALLLFVLVQLAMSAL